MKKDKVKKWNKYIRVCLDRGYSFIFLVLLLIFILAIFLKPTITGLTTVTNEVGYNESLYLVFNESSEYVWLLENVGELKSLRLSGSLTDGTKAKVYISYNNLTYLVFDSALTESGLGTITGLVVLNETTNETVINETEPIKNISKIKNSIINLKYKENSSYDTDNDGIETLTGVIDFGVDVEFNWNVSYDKLCTRWEVYNQEESTIVCYGDADCCSLLELVPERAVWNETFYLNYGKYGAGYNNKVTAQVIYADYSLVIPYSDIVYSDYDEKDAKFLPAALEFNDLCVDTCLLSGFNASSYKLIINVSNGSFSLTTISYSILEEVVNKAPYLVKNISTVNINKNENLSIDLSEYFTDPDNYELSYSYYGVENITVLIEEDTAVIVPDKGFTGKRYSYFIANDSSLIAVSDVFAVDVREIVKKFKITDSSGATVASIDDKGHLYIKGNLFEKQIELNPPKNSFIIQNKNKDIVAYINSRGYVFLKGDLTEQAALSAATNSLEIRDAANRLIAFFDSKGNLKLKGLLEENVKSIG